MKAESPQNERSDARPSGSGVLCRTAASQKLLRLHQRPAAASWKAVQNVVQQLGLDGFAFAQPVGADQENKSENALLENGVALLWVWPPRFGQVAAPSETPETLAQPIVSLPDLPPEARRAAEQRLRVLLPALRSAARAKGPECAALMDVALQVPDLSAVRVKGEKIVLAPWGMAPWEPSAENTPKNKPSLGATPLSAYLEATSEPMTPDAHAARLNERLNDHSNARPGERTRHAMPASASPTTGLKPFYVPVGLATWLSVLLCVGTGLLFFALAFHAVLWLGWGSWLPAFSWLPL